MYVFNVVFSVNLYLLIIIIYLLFKDVSGDLLYVFSVALFIVFFPILFLVAFVFNSISFPGTGPGGYS